MDAPGMLQIAQSCCLPFPHHSLQQKMLQDCNFFPPAHKPQHASHPCSSLLCSHPFPIAPESLPLHHPAPQGPGQAGVRADRGLAVGKSTILKERERSVKV